MAYLNILYTNHMDLMWRRPRYVAGLSGGYKIAPYSELQERQIDRALDFVRDGGKYGIEQTITLREYLDRNPDRFDEIREAIRNGQLSILGGGESVIDYNLSDGESVIRNHLYSRRWLSETFGVAPTLAALPDTFGLSANLPGFFRQLGYRGLVYFHRVFKDCKPYWKGLNGEFIVLGTAMPQNGVHKNGHSFTGQFRKSRACTICGGDGCPACEFSGMELRSDPITADGFETYWDEHGHEFADGDVTFLFNSEEGAIPANAMETLKKVAAKSGRTLRCISDEELALELRGDLLDHVDNPPADQVDPRIEGNPVATGCYTSRIRMKQEARRCESALRAAERLAVAAALEGEPYPAKTLEYWWRKLMYLLFHDAIPSSHSDDGHTELLEVARGLRAGVSRIALRSAKKLLAKAEISGDGIPFAVLNPLEFGVENARLTGAFKCDKTTEGGKVIAPDGSECPVLAFRASTISDCNETIVEFIGNLPAFGYGIFRFIPDENYEEPSEQLKKKGCVLENDFLRVEFGPYSLQRVFDKVKGCVIAEEGTFAPLIVDDPGHLWGREGVRYGSERGDMGNHSENMVPPREFSRKVTFTQGDGFQRATIYITYARDEKEIEHMDWAAEFTLANNARELKVRIRTHFDARNMKLSTQVVLPKAPVDEMLEYEIPLGKLSRGPVSLPDDMLGVADEWATLRYVTADLGDTRVTLCNNGTPGHSIVNNTIRVSLLRTPTLLCCAYGIKGAIDKTENVFDFTLAADTDNLDAYRRGATLNTEFTSIHLRAQCGTMPASGSFFSLPTDCMMLGLKGAEDGNGYIVRYLGNPEETKMTFAAPVTICNVLEDDCTCCEPAKEITVKPFDIVTLRLGKDALGK